MDITATTTELNYTDGVTSAIQTQLDAKATNVDGLSDALVEDNSMYIGSDPSNTTICRYNISLGSTSLDAITTGDANVSIGYNALTVKYDR